jgi:hypothetical protein
MTGAVTRSCKRGVFGVAVVLAAVTFAGHPDRGSSAAQEDGAVRAAAALPASIQALELGPVVARSASKQWLRARRAHGANAVIVDRTRLGSASFAQARDRSQSSGMPVLAPVAVGNRAAGAAACNRLARAGRPCFLLAASARAAVKISSIHGSVVAVRLSGLGAFRSLGARGHGRILGIVPLRLSAGRVAWQKMIDLARRSALLDLAVAPVAGAKGARSLLVYEQLLVGKSPAGAPGAGGGDTTPPSVPSGLRRSSATATSVSLAWNASTDNVGVAGYYLSQDGARVGTTTALSYTFASLACGKSYSLAVSAHDAVGNVSNPALATTVEATAACTAAPPPPPPPAPPSGGASGSVFVATGGSDGNPCSAAAPCASFNRAYRVAQPGQVVEVAAGTYSSQTIQADSSKTSTSDVVIRPASGATVTVGCPSNGSGCIDVYASHLTLSGFRTAQMPSRGSFAVQGSISQERAAGNCPCDVTWESIDAGSFQLTGTDITVRGGDYGPSATNNGGAAGANVNSQFVEPLNNVTLDGVVIHDYRIAFDGDHFECLFVDGATNVVIRNSEFRSCDVFAIAAIIEPGQSATGWLIENTVFWNPAGAKMTNDIKFDDSKGGTCNSITIRYNLISDNVYDGCPSMTVVANIQRAAQATCVGGWDYNVFVNATACGSHSRSIGDARFVNAGAGNFRLQAGSTVIDAGKPGYGPATDKDGAARPRGAASDAGPYEIG